jgi:hypothetical protein
MARSITSNKAKANIEKVQEVLDKYELDGIEIWIDDQGYLRATAKPEENVSSTSPSTFQNRSIISNGVNHTRQCKDEGEEGRYEVCEQFDDEDPAVKELLESGAY